MKRYSRTQKISAAACAAVIVLGAAVYVRFHHPLAKQESASAQQQDQEILAFHQKYFDSEQQYSGSVQQAVAKTEQAPAINGILTSYTRVRRPFAVVVENHPAARPQSGLSQADIVYEALAEGGITRYMAVFQTQNVSMIGPVRSARTYFNDWAQELSAVFAHVGGNSDALYYLHHGVPGVTDADQFYNAAYFWRIKNRKAPHNVYTSTANLSRLTANKSLDMAAHYKAYQFKNDEPAANLRATTIKIAFSTPQFAVKWVYDRAANAYKRYLAGKADIDSGNKVQIKVKNIIVQIVGNWPVKNDTPLAISMGTRAGGTAYFFIDGAEQKGTWRYEDGHTVFYDSSEHEIQLNRGQTWIEIVPPAFESQLVWR